nr:16S rRNA (uracil(1498)-N(3))-methyltransferase [Actinomycetota bacterium]
MSRALFYVDVVPEPGELVVVDGDEGFHAASVRRLRIGEELDVGDGVGRVAHVVVDGVFNVNLTTRVLR